MSASREKKIRQDLAAQGVTDPKKIREAEEKAKAAEPTCLRAQYGVFAGVNVTHASDAPATGLRETNLWSAALGIEYNEAEANKAFDEYIAKYEGKTPFLGEEVQKLAADLKATAAALKEALAKEAADPADADALLRICLGNL